MIVGTFDDQCLARHFGISGAQRLRYRNKCADPGRKVRGPSSDCVQAYPFLQDSHVRLLALDNAFLRFDVKFNVLFHIHITALIVQHALDSGCHEGRKEQMSQCAPRGPNVPRQATLGAKQRAMGVEASRDGARSHSQESEDATEAWAEEVSPVGWDVGIGAVA